MSVFETFMMNEKINVIISNFWLEMYLTCIFKYFFNLKNCNISQVRWYCIFINSILRYLDVRRLESKRPIKIVSGRRGNSPDSCLKIISGSMLFFATFFA